MQRDTLRAGFTLVELLVVIAIIGILLSLFMTGLGPTLENVRRTKCSVNLQQLCKAAINYEVSRDQLPGYVQKFGEFPGGVDPTDPGNYSGNVPPHVKLGPWTVTLLEKLDNQPLSEFWTQDQYPLLCDGGGDRPATAAGYSRVAATNLSVFQCPSATGSIARHGLNNYIANVGFHADAFPFTYTRPGEAARTVTFARSIHVHNGVFTNRYRGLDPTNPSGRVVTGNPVRSDDFIDGRTHTMLFTESNQAAPWHRTRVALSTSHITNFSQVGGERLTTYLPETRYLQGAAWHFEDPANYAGASPVKRLHKINGGDVYNDEMTTTNMADLARPSSLHPGGVNIGFADGRVSFVSETIDYRVYQAMCTPNGRSSDVPMNMYLITPDSI